MCLIVAGAQAVPLHQLRMPPGFHIEVFADPVPNARQLALGPDGTIYVGSRSAGAVYALRDTDGDGKADQIKRIAAHLNVPNGVAVVNGALYVAELNRILRYEDIGAHLDNPPAPTVVHEQLPSDTLHGWKYLKQGPDNKLYFAVGAPCNVCLKDQPIYGTIVRMNVDGSDFEIYAQGVRNTVGMDWHPQTKELWFTENGRDLLGDDVPPDELNRAATAGLHFGFPYCFGSAIADPAFGTLAPCDRFTPPALKFAAHNAPLGMTFYTGTQFPQRYHQQLFVAQHGSWNRRKPDGYRVALVKFDGADAVAHEPFIDGWLGSDGKAWGRPVDVLQLADGSLLISDDTASVVYRLKYTGIPTP